MIISYHIYYHEHWHLLLAALNVHGENMEVVDSRDIPSPV